MATSIGLAISGCEPDDARPFGTDGTLGGGKVSGSDAGSDAGGLVRGGDSRTGGTGGGVLNVTTDGGAGGSGGGTVPTSPGGQTETGGATGSGGARVGTGGSGGAAATGGRLGSGGAPTGTGGGVVVATGGRVGTGGSSGTGGARTGGAPGTGGTHTGGVTGTGGAVPATGGVTGTGGAAPATGGAAGGTDATTAECRQYIIDYDAEMKSARACATLNASNGPNLTCDMLATAKLAGCGSNCATYVSSSTGLDVIRKKWTRAGCVDPVCTQPVTCTQPKSGTCNIVTGMCTDNR